MKTKTAAQIAASLPLSQRVALGTALDGEVDGRTKPHIRRALRNKGLLPAGGGLLLTTEGLKVKILGSAVGAGQLANDHAEALAQNTTPALVHTGDCIICCYGREAETLEAGIAAHNAEHDHEFVGEDDADSDTGRGDHFGPCAQCGISYEARSAEQAIEDHDMHEGHPFTPSNPA